MTRRADTLWAALARTEAPNAVVEATLPLLHGRAGQAAGPPAHAQAGRQAAAQVRGVVLARAIAEGRSVAQELPAREARVRAQRRDLRKYLAELRAQILGLTAWSPGLEDAIAEGLQVLDLLDRIAMDGEPLPGDAGELDAFLAALPEIGRAHV